MTTGRRVATREQPAVQPPPPPPASAPRSTGTGSGGAAGKALLFLLVAGGLGLAAVGLLRLERSGVDVATRLTPEELSPITPIGAPPGRPTPGADGEPSGAAARPPADDAPDKGEPDEAPTRAVKQGWLTLVVLPEAEVTLNGRSLGKTPLFKVQVPAGQHRLRIKGADGKRRELSVPIAAGKTAQFKLALTDIPER